MNQMREKRHDCTQNIETLQEEAYNVKTKLEIVQGMVKQTIQESAEKLKTHITTETTEGIVQQET
jgi:hypothetical protein